MSSLYHRDDEPLSQTDRLIDQLINHEGDAQTWADWRDFAGTDAQLWRQLAEAQRDATALRRLGQLTDGAADRVELPLSVPAASRTASAAAGSILPEARARPWPRLAWAGWAVAAALLLSITLLAPRLLTPTHPDGETIATPVDAPQTAADAFQQYLDLGRDEGLVLDELPARVLIDARPVEGGEGFDLLYLRQVIERVRVPHLYQYQSGGESSSDEDGAAASLVRYEKPIRGPM